MSISTVSIVHVLFHKGGYLLRIRCKKRLPCLAPESVGNYGIPIVRPCRVTYVDYTKCPRVRPAKGKATRELGSCPGKAGREYVTDEEGFDDVRNYFFWKTFYLYRCSRMWVCWLPCTIEKGAWKQGVAFDHTHEERAGPSG